MTTYAYYALFKFRIMPWEFVELNKRELASLTAMIDVRIEDDKKQADKLK